MIADYVKHNFQQCIVWGILLQCLGGLMPLGWGRPTLSVLGWAMMIGGTLLTVIGFGYYVATKSRAPAWSLLALVPIVGWVILVLLKPKSAWVADASTSQRGI